MENEKFLLFLEESGKFLLFIKTYDKFLLFLRNLGSSPVPSRSWKVSAVH